MTGALKLLHWLKCQAVWKSWNHCPLLPMHDECPRKDSEWVKSKRCQANPSVCKQAKTGWDPKIKGSVSRLVFLTVVAGSHNQIPEVLEMWNFCSIGRFLFLRKRLCRHQSNEVTFWGKERFFRSVKPFFPHQGDYVLLLLQKFLHYCIISK